MGACGGCTRPRLDQPTSDAELGHRRSLKHEPIPKSRRRHARTHDPTVRSLWSTNFAVPNPSSPGISERVPLCESLLACLTKEGLLGSHSPRPHLRRGPPAAASQLGRKVYQYESPRSTA